MKRYIQGTAVVIALMGTALLVYGLSSASSSEKKERVLHVDPAAAAARERGIDLRPAHAESASVYSRKVVDGAAWTLRAWETKSGHMCVEQAVPSEGVGTTCIEEANVFSRAPVRLLYGSRQHPGNTKTWDNAWLWGFASKAVGALNLVNVNCVSVPICIGQGGMFHHVMSSAVLHSGALPYKVIARDQLGGKVIYTELVKLGGPVQGPAGSRPDGRC